MNKQKNLQATWNLSSLFKSDTDTKMDSEQELVKKKTYQFIKKWQSRDDYLTDPKVLKQALGEYESWLKNYGTSGALGYYISLRTSQDQNNPKLKALQNKIDDFSTSLQNDIQFFTLRIAKIPSAMQPKFLKAKELTEYKHFLEKLFAESKYLLSESEEKILNLKQTTSFANWVRMTSAFLSKEERLVATEEGKSEVKNFSQIISLINSQKKPVRDGAAKALNDIQSKFVEVAENELNSILTDKKINDELRGVTRPDLIRHLSDDIDSKVVDTLVEEVSQRFDISSRFYQLKAQLLKLKKLEYHERNVEYGSVTLKYSYPKSVGLINKVFQNLDPQFAQIFNQFLINGQIDVYPKKGKRGGAFCAHELLTQPTYILLNHTDKLNDCLTLAHELGHGINNELVRGAQHSLNFDTPLSTAEVASTFMEDFVLEEILKTADDEQKLSIQMMKLNDDISTIFRQVACYKFEIELHHNFRKKGYLSKEEIGEIFQKNMSSYMGKFVEQSKGSENWWVYWSHIRSYFYVYSYASGLLISKSLQGSVKSDKEFILKVKQFLSAGTSDSPSNIFQKLGIDISDKTFWKKGLDEIEQLLSDTTALAKKLDKI